MRTLIVTENVTLDGVIDATEGWFDVSVDPEIDQTDMLSAHRDHQEAADAVLMGRVTFEEMRSYWPLQTDDKTGITDYLNKVSKHMISTTLNDPEWENTVVVRGPLIDAVEALKSKPGNDIVTTGSMTVVRDLIPTGLVDEYRLFVYPVVIGRGQRLFADAIDAPKLRLQRLSRFAPASFSCATDPLMRLSHKPLAPRRGPLRAE